ncbi:MAG: SUMF1/EgtB/PvdO family nonheme iron enzyme [Gemmatimonadetes bacterium]|nr:SUMF1/EgtB/PvdO family nonheme iron enzyme [Gemmatimonadota bacterium]
MKRRRVFRTAAAYGAGAFVALEGIDLLAEGLLLPVVLLRASTVIALAGFPIAIALSWIFEIRSDGRLARTQGANETELAELFREARVRRWGSGLLGLGGIALLIAGIVTGSGGVWLLSLRNQDALFAARALPRIEQLILDQEFVQAYDLATQLSAVTGPDAVSDEMWEAMSQRVSIESDPSGATVHVQPFSPDAPWTELGKTPLVDARVAAGVLRWRVELDGFVDGELVGQTSGRTTLSFVLQAEGSPESTMVRVPAGTVRLFAMAGVRAAPSVSVGEFLIDRFEVRNVEFARFVEAGGYEREEFWHQEFLDGQLRLTFEEAMARFLDSTGRSGPSNWEFGTYPDGQGNHPVGGVSWYEAEA